MAIKHVQSEYKCVQGVYYTLDDITKWVVNIKGVARVRYDTEREAAIAVDKFLIRKGKEPINILTRKTSK